MHIGYHCLTWGRDGVVRAMEEIAELGYEGIEIFDAIAGDYDKRRGEFMGMLDEHALALAGIYVGGVLSTREDFARDLDHCKRCADFLKECDGEIVVLGGGARAAGVSVNDAIKQMAENCNRIGEVVRGMELSAAYHPHLGTLIENREEIGRFMELTEPGLVWLAPDTGHITAAGADAVEVFRAYIDRIAYVHLKDVNPTWLERKKHEPNPKVRVFSELGTGPVDFPAIIDILKAHEFEDWLMVELDDTETSPAESAEMSKRYIREKLGL
jgi:inosose dehydratase